MGNNSEKKIAQFKDKVIGYYFYPTIVVAVLFILVNIYTEYLLSVWGAIFVTIISFVQYFSYNQISKSLELGLNTDSYSIYIDVLALNGGIQFGSCFFDFFWYGYWIIPLLILYKGGQVVWGWLQKPQYVQDEGKKKKEKKEKVKYIK